MRIWELITGADLRAAVSAAAQASQACQALATSSQAAAPAQEEEMTTASKQPPTTECDKMLAVSEESNKIGAFLAWLRDEKKLSICNWSEFDEDEEDGSGEGGYYYPVHSGDRGINQLLAEYYGIDLDKMEQERRALLAWLRERA